MLNTNDAGTESRSLRGLERMMSVIVTACSAFGLTVSEANTEMVRLKTTGWRKMSVTLNAAGQVYKQTIEDRFYDSPPPPSPPLNRRLCLTNDSWLLDTRNDAIDKTIVKLFFRLQRIVEL